MARPNVPRGYLLVDIFVADVADGYGQESRECGLSLLAHALPDGSFSMTDDRRDLEQAIASLE